MLLLVEQRELKGFGFAIGVLVLEHQFCGSVLVSRILWVPEFLFWF